MEFTQKSVGFWVLNFGMFVGGAFYLYGGSFWKKYKAITETSLFCDLWNQSRKKIKALAKTSFFVSFGLRAENILIFYDKFSALLSKLHFESVELFCDSFSTNNIVYLFRDLSKILLEFWSEIFGNFCQNCFLFYRGSFWRETNLSKKHSVSHPLWTWRGNCFD